MMTTFKALRVLIVDDEPLANKLIQSQLINLGHSVAGEAFDGPQAVALTCQLRPDVVLMDLQMPDPQTGLDDHLAGLQAAQVIQKQCPAPVILLTAHESPELLQRASDAGVGAYLVKPSRENDLARAITITRARFDDSMELRRLNAGLQDEIAARVRAQEALRESEEKFRATISQSADGILVTDEDFRIIEWSAAQTSMFGYTREEMLGKPLWEFQYLTAPSEQKSPALLKLLKDLLFEARAQGDAAWMDAIYDFDVQARDGSRKIVQTSFFPITTSGGNLYGSINRDITAQVRAEAALRQSEERLDLAMSVANDGIWDWHADNDITLFDSRYYTMSGYEPNEFPSTHKEWEKRVHPDDLEQTKLTVEQYLAGERQVYDVEFRFLRKGGDYMWIRARGKIVARDEKGNPTRFVGTHSDITARVRAQEALRQYTDELKASNEELDAFAHTAAHDLKGPLGYMVGFAQVLEQDYATLPDEETRRYLHTIAQSGRKMSNIIDELLLLAGVRGMEEIEPQALDMQGIVIAALKRSTGLIEENQAEIITPQSWPQALGYGPWIEEVWVNYVSNAIKYGGQPPRVELGFTSPPQAGGTEGEAVCFWVRDNGEGLTADEQERLFTPFTRLDQVRAKGHGLGLSIVQRIVEKLGGEVGVESKAGQGSLFWFTLPVAEQ